MKIFIWTLTASIFFLDQLSKFLISSTFDINESVEVIENVFFLTLVHNTGAAFGIFKRETLFFIVVSVVAVIAIVAYMRSKRSRAFLADLGLAFILGGALGNLADRLRLGYVIDFLDFKIWPVFNVADSAITLGAFILMLSLLYPKKRDTR